MSRFEQIHGQGKESSRGRSGLHREEWGSGLTLLGRGSGDGEADILLVVGEERWRVC